MEIENPFEDQNRSSTSTIVSQLPDPQKITTRHSIQQKANKTVLAK